MTLALVALTAAYVGGQVACWRWTIRQDEERRGMER